MENKILFVDDNPRFLEGVIHMLSDEFICEVAHTIEEGIEKLCENPQVVLLDIEFNTKDLGIKAIPRFKEIDPSIPIIMLTKYDNYEVVVKAMKTGASDYFVKSPKMNELKKVIKDVIEKNNLQNQVENLKKELSTIRGTLVGSGTKMSRVIEEIHRASELDCPVLITGETGSGKELVARAIHEYGTRKDAPFLPLNVTTITNDLFSTELFGYEKGAFTGASLRKKGLFEIAGTGTIFLDEIGYLPIESQVKLLRVLDDKLIMRVGGTSEIKVHARVLSATNQDLQKAVKKGTFRDDLLFRLNAFVIHIPPLRERQEDVEEIIGYYLNQYGKELNIFENNALDLLRNYDWPGNVRQLKNVIEILVSNRKVDKITSTQVSRYLVKNEYSEDLDFSPTYYNMDYKIARNKILSEFRKQYLEKLLQKTNHNITEASKLSGLNRSAIHKMLE